jgi:arylsulfatase A-like enzyme
VRDGSGFFLYVHYMEPHPPYGNTEKLTRLLDGRPVPDIAGTSAAYMASRRKPLTPEQMERVEEVYDAEVAEMDDGVAWLVRSLHDLRMLDHTVIVFTADHGEEFLDHGGTGHGATLHEELVHVPLIVAAPDAAPRVVDDTVALIDVAPTVLDLLGIPAPREFQGRSLAAEIVPPGSIRAFFRRLVGFFQPSEPGVALSHVAERTERPDPANAQRAVVRGLHKAIAVGQNPPEYYDLVVDPRERSPAALTPEERAPLDRLLQALREREPAAPAETEPLDPAKRRQLRALGYVD